MTAEEIRVILAEVAARRGGPPHRVRSDNGPEFAALVVQSWLETTGSGTLYVAPRSSRAKCRPGRYLSPLADHVPRRFGSKAWVGDDWLEGKVGAAGQGGLKARLAEAKEALRKVRESVAELEGRLKRVEAEAGAGQPAGSAASRPTPGGAKSGRRSTPRRPG